MATVNTPALAAIAPVAARNPAAQGAPQQAEPTYDDAAWLAGEPQDGAA